MNYSKHYNKLMERATNRTVTGYTEKHHVTPRCLNGTNDTNNIVKLTPEEHYVAHQLLVKIYPDSKQLLHAALMMGVASKNHQRNNKQYGWLKRKYLVECKQRIGKNNPSYGKSWYHNPKTLVAGKFLLADVPFGWTKGRVPGTKCKTCNIPISPAATYCATHVIRSKHNSRNPFNGREAEFYKFYNELGSMNKACKAMGFPGAVSTWHRRAKELLDIASVSPRASTSVKG